jgi:hypothetical protein
LDMLTEYNALTPFILTVGSNIYNYDIFKKQTNK